MLTSWVGSLSKHSLYTSTTAINMPEGAESPPPERQTGAQLHDTPASGKGTDSSENKEEVNKSGLEVSLLKGV